MSETGDVRGSILLPLGLGWGAGISLIYGLERGFGGSEGVRILGPLAFLSLLVAACFLIRQLTLKPRPHSWFSILLFLLYMGSVALWSLGVVLREMSA